MVDWAAAATAGATAIATTAGTELWKDLHTRLKTWFTKLGGRKADKALQRLDATATEIESSPEDQGVRDKAKSTWQTRFEVFLDDLEDDERDALAQELLELARKAEQEQAGAGAVAGDHGMAVAGDVNVTAKDHGIAVAHNEGGINMGNPLQPRRAKKD
ncbi:hypothetical protein KIK06_24700 [Nocardiopsis sp. EMB25]|uniref:hypothetical protein n=1 Tax=Nocardiopsis sp. EMB25 TaxID=2835867 RepID=UPI0022851A96|nr:hypothetical protein [Nocardiopsis sp. EMB25]MCY9787089.1 hypothetical protein [Nocardiopsis sp. EMB25]